MNKQWYYLCIAIILLGLLLRLPLLLVIGLLGVLILAATDIWAKYWLQDLRYQRQFSEQLVLFAKEKTLSLTVEQSKLLHLPCLQIPLTIPPPPSIPSPHL